VRALEAPSRHLYKSFHVDGARIMFCKELRALSRYTSKREENTSRYQTSHYDGLSHICRAYTSPQISVYEILTAPPLPILESRSVSSHIPEDVWRYLARYSTSPVVDLVTTYRIRERFDEAQIQLWRVNNPSWTAKLSRRWILAFCVWID
jgi:hypothetical protein